MFMVIITRNPISLSIMKVLICCYESVKDSHQHKKSQWCGFSKVETFCRPNPIHVNKQQTRSCTKETLQYWY